tara:strand:- start:10523 stop:12268 length:1746 start_codon:yes stop_codon:yes gene_type:complete
MSSSVQIASVFTAIGFKVNKKDLDRLQKQLIHLKKQLSGLRRVSKINVETNLSGLRAAKAQLAGINSELSKIKAKKLSVNVNRGGSGGGGGGRGRGGLSGAAGGAAASGRGRGGAGVAIAAGGLGFAGMSLLKTGQRLEAVRAGLTAAAGGAKEGAAEFQFMVDLSERLGINFEDNVRSYQNFIAAGRSLNFGVAKSREVFTATASAARVLGLSAADTNGVMRAMTQILSKGTVQSEELRGQLGERLPGAVGMMAKAIGVNVEELNKMLEQGEVISKDVLPKMAEAMIEFAETAGALDKAVNSNLANQERLANAWWFFKANIAQSGFMDTMTNTFVELAKILNTDSEAAGTLGTTFSGLARIVQAFVSVFGNLFIAFSEMPVAFKLIIAALVFMLIPFATWGLAIFTVIGLLDELFALLRGEENLFTTFAENAGLLEYALLGVSAAIFGILAAGKLSLMFTGMRAAAGGVTALSAGLGLVGTALKFIGKHPVFLALSAIAAIAGYIYSKSNFEGDTEAASMKAGLARGFRGRDPAQSLPNGAGGQALEQQTVKVEIALEDGVKASISEIQANQPTATVVPN